MFMLWDICSLLLGPPATWHLCYVTTLSRPTQSWYWAAMDGFLENGPFIFLASAFFVYDFSLLTRAVSVIPYEQYLTLATLE